MRNKEIAKAVITSYLSNKLSFESLGTVYEIQNGDDELLLEHVKALKNIFERAIKEIEGEKDDRN